MWEKNLINLSTWEQFEQAVTAEELHVQSPPSLNFDKPLYYSENLVNSSDFRQNVERRHRKCIILETPKGNIEQMFATAFNAIKFTLRSCTLAATSPGSFLISL